MAQSNLRKRGMREDLAPRRPDTPPAEGIDAETLLDRGDIADDAQRDDAAEPRPIPPDRLRGSRP
jgi:hypothetical protein